LAISFRAGVQTAESGGTAVGTTVSSAAERLLADAGAQRRAAVDPRHQFEPAAADLDAGRSGARGDEQGAAAHYLGNGRSLLRGR
jgi:hypothetical protein